MAFPAVHTMLRFPWNTNVPPKPKTELSDINLSVPKWIGSMTNPSGGLTDNAAVKIPVPLQDVAVWSIFIPKKISVLILEQSVAPKNGIIHTKSELLLSEGFITSKSISASPGAEPRMRKHSMHISSLQGSPNSLPLFLLIKSTATNTFEAWNAHSQVWVPQSPTSSYLILRFPALTRSTACLRRQFAIYFHNFMRWQTTPDLF